MQRCERDKREVRTALCMLYDVLRLQPGVTSYYVCLDSRSCVVRVIIRGGDDESQLLEQLLKWNMFSARFWNSGVTSGRWQVFGLTMDNIVGASSWSRFALTTFDITGFARHHNATTGDVTLSRRLTATAFGLAVASGSLTVALRCPGCCKRPRAAFGALSSSMHC